MVMHADIELRSLELAREIVKRIDDDPRRRGLSEAKERCRRWLEKSPCMDLMEWKEILEKPWESVRIILLDPSEHGRQLRQSNPFCGILSPRERWAIYRRFRSHDQKPA